MMPPHEVAVSFACVLLLPPVPMDSVPCTVSVAPEPIVTVAPGVMVIVTPEGMIALAGIIWPSAQLPLSSMTTPPASPALPLLLLEAPLLPPLDPPAVPPLLPELVVPPLPEPVVVPPLELLLAPPLLPGWTPAMPP
jgi:hypothetical protein